MSVKTRVEELVCSADDQLFAKLLNLLFPLFV